MKKNHRDVKLMQFVQRTTTAEVSALIEAEMAKPMFASGTQISSMIKTIIAESATGAALTGVPLLPMNAKIGVTMDRSTGIPVASYSNGVTVMEINGALLHRDVSDGCGYSPVSYEGIRASMDRIVADEPNVVVARINSGGGSASQLVDLNAHLRKVMAENPDVRFIACVDDQAASAAFGIASAFPERYVSNTGMIGSVGVVTRHTSVAEAEAKAGIAHTYLYKGDKKIYGNSSEPLSEEAKAEIMGQVEGLYESFTACISESIGMSVEDVRATEAGLYSGQAAVDIGFATGVKTYPDLMAELFSDEQSTAPKSPEGMEASLDVGDGTEVKLADDSEVKADAALTKTQIIAQCEAAGLDQAVVDMYSEMSLTAKQLTTMIGTTTGEVNLSTVTDGDVDQDTGGKTHAELVDSWKTALK